MIGVDRLADEQAALLKHVQEEADLFVEFLRIQFFPVEGSLERSHEATGQLIIAGLSAGAIHFEGLAEMFFHFHADQDLEGEVGPIFEALVEVAPAGKVEEADQELKLMAVGNQLAQAADDALGTGIGDEVFGWHGASVSLVIFTIRKGLSPVRQFCSQCAGFLQSRIQFFLWFL